MMEIESDKLFFEDEGKTWDILLISLEAGKTWTILYPEYTTLYRREEIKSFPASYVVAMGNTSLLNFMNSWLAIQQSSGYVDSLYNYWILGENAKPKKARWSVIKDVLHYFPATDQETLLKRCGQKLNAGGTIIIRDGIEDEKQKHGVTKMTEVFSTKIFGFNKVEHQLEFLPEERVLSFAEEFNLTVERLENKASSNVTFVLKKAP